MIELTPDQDTIVVQGTIEDSVAAYFAHFKTVTQFLSDSGSAADNTTHDVHNHGDENGKHILF